MTPARVPEVKGLFAPVETAVASPVALLAAKLEAEGIGLAEATEYLRSQAVTEATVFDDITEDEARAAITGFAHLVSALSTYAESK